MTIDEYLAELERRLPRTHRQRFVAEAAEHLRDAAERYRRCGHDQDAAERAAIESFGDVSLVARRFSAASAAQDVRRAATLAFVATVLLVLPLYGIPENTLPPARWDAKPADIAVLQSLAIGLWAVGLVLAFAGVACALSRHVRLVAPWSQRAHSRSPDSGSSAPCLPCAGLPPPRGRRSGPSSA
jgi:hypothetical protein